MLKNTLKFLHILLFLLVITASITLASVIALAKNIEPLVLHGHKTVRVYAPPDSTGKYEEYTSADSVYVEMIDSTPYIYYWDYGYEPRYKYWIVIFNADIYRWGYADFDVYFTYT